jgi:hypothetical protein
MHMLLGVLSSLSRVIPQTPLPAGMEDALLKELSTHGMVPDLTKLLETMIRFLAASMPHATPGQGGVIQSLSEVALHTLFMGAEQWEAISTPLLRTKYVTTAFLAEIYRLCESGLGDDPVSKVDSRYRAPLPPSLSALLSDRVLTNRGVDSRSLAVQLSVVLHGALAENTSIRGDISLKNDFLVHIEGFEGLKGFAQFFPVELRVEHIVDVYLRIVEHLRRTS